MTDRPLLHLEALTKRYGRTLAVDGISASIRRGELVSFVGPSGCGKTTLLRLIGGFLRPDAGRITLDGESITALPPNRRPTAMVFQNYALFPHMTVAQNIGFALDRWPRRERQERVTELVTLLGLEGLESRLPGAISGGQQQRVALGRALAARPQVLLLDEPFTALDAPIRNVLRREVARLRRQLGLLALFVTHDLQEAYSLADRIAVYDAGEVLQFGPREEVFGRPVSVRVAQLLDARNVIEGTVLRRTEAFVEVKTPWFMARCRPDADVSEGQKAAVCVRPEHVILLRREREHSMPLETVIDVELEDEIATGNNHRLYLRVVNDQGPTDCVLEADISAHPYVVMGVSQQKQWRVALSLGETGVIPGTSD